MDEGFERVCTSCKMRLHKEVVAQSSPSTPSNLHSTPTADLALPSASTSTSTPPVIPQISAPMSSSSTSPPQQPLPRTQSALPINSASSPTTLPGNASCSMPILNGTVATTAASNFARTIRDSSYVPICIQNS